MKHPSHPTAQRVQDFARYLGLDIRVVEFSESTRTAAAAAAAVGCSVGQIVKSLVFMVRDEPVICLVSGANRLDERKLSTWFGVSRKHVKQANAEQVRQATGYAIGGVAPIGYPRLLAMVMDEDLMQYETIWAAAGTPNSVFAVTPEALRHVTQASIIDLKRETG